MRDFIVANLNYWIYVVLMMIGLYAMIAKNNLVKKLIGMSIFQTAIILFYVSIGVKSGATIPIIEHHASLPVKTGVHLAMIPAAHAEPSNSHDTHIETKKAKPHIDMSHPSNAHQSPSTNSEHETAASHTSENTHDSHGKPQGHNAHGDSTTHGDTGAHHGDHHAIHAKDYNNPLPHVLMLTAIVVGVATLGVGLAVVQKIYQEYGTAEENEILALVRQESAQQGL